ncbi:hypothetical protein NQ314_000091 [Rhamnusium bicolor]|uniref:Sialin n=1 Tax=Rhamnusium bicolor TaxID=1586634 RepID=A0AAV8ZXZ0_9CUCU|nr:hypothetical protein NQ314_000091 [Rhamnusium bicolor]
MYAHRDQSVNDGDSDSNYEEEDEDELTSIIQPEGFANVYAMRVNLSVAIVAMVNSTAVPHPPPNNNTFDHCPVPDRTNSTPIDGEFAWDEKTQGLVLGSFFYGYVLTQVPGGRLAELFGGKLVYGLGVLITAVFTLLSPIAARINFPLFIIVRILEGMGEGVTFPSMHAMLARWIPPLERSKFGAYVYAGTNFGTIISLPLSGWLCSLESGHGWPLSFYLFGIIGIIWFVLWMFLIYDTPTSHPRIDRQEKAFILASIGPQVFNSIASVIPSLGLLGVAYVGCDKVWAQLLLAVPGAFGGAVYAGNQMNHIALSPKYAGTMYGITNAAANTCGFLAPYVIGLIIEGRETLGQWRMVFYLAAGINMGANLFYVAFASAREQPWSRSQRLSNVN